MKSLNDAAVVGMRDHIVTIPHNWDKKAEFTANNAMFQLDALTIGNNKKEDKSNGRN